MAKFRPRYTIRTLLAITTLCAAGFAIWKCEAIAKHEFAVKVDVVRDALSDAVHGAENDLYDEWKMEARDTNPTFAIWEKETKWWKCTERTKKMIVVADDGSTAKWGGDDYFTGQWHEWTVIRSTMSAREDFSKPVLRASAMPPRINVKITCWRPWSLCSRATWVTILDRGAPNNRLFMERIKKQLDDHGITYSVSSVQDNMRP